MVGSVILIVMGVMALIGIGSNAVRDFDIPVLAVVLTFAAIVGLNFLPVMNVGNFYFGWGTALLLAATLCLWLFKGKIANRLMCFLIAALLSGLLYGAVQLSRFYGNALWGDVNIYYALMAGLLAFLFTRNAKYGFISGVLSVTAATLLTQIGGKIDLDAAYSFSVVSGALAVVLYSVVAKLMPSRPGKMSYYFETGRMLDE